MAQPQLFQLEGEDVRTRWGYAGRVPADRQMILERSLCWLGHASFRIEANRRTIYIDPYRVGGGPVADLVLITHDHFDHFSPEDVRAVSKRGTVVIAPATVAERIKGPVVSISPGEAYEQDGIDVRAVAAYNTNKIDSEGQPFHPRESGWVGYLLTVGGFSIYHSGDTDVIPEMDQAAAVDIALLPVSGTYVMTATEAAEAARRIDPGVAVPMHWGTLIGERSDAEEFVRAVPGEARIVEPELSEEKVASDGN